VILAAGIDLSVGAVMGAAMIIAAQLTGGRDQLPFPRSSWHWRMGAGVGLLNGLLVTKRRVPPFVATLAMLVLVEGARLAYTKGIRVQYPAIAARTRRDALGPFPSHCSSWWVSRAVGGLLLYQAPFRPGAVRDWCQPRGGASVGIAVDRVTTITYIVCGLLAALGGLLLSGYIGYVDRYLGRGLTWTRSPRS